MATKFFGSGCTAKLGPEVLERILPCCRESRTRIFWWVRSCG